MVSNDSARPRRIFYAENKRLVKSNKCLVENKYEKCSERLPKMQIKVDIYIILKHIQSKYQQVKIARACTMPI